MERLTNLIAGLFVLHFLWSYYRNCYRKGYRLDLWHFNLLFNLFVIHIMLPFNRSDLNIIAVGPILLRRIQSNVTEAYLISTLGYVCILLGGSLWRVHLGFGLRHTFSQLLEVPTHAALILLQSRRLLILHGIIASTLIVGVLLYYFKVAGFGFNVRSILYTNAPLRAVSNFTSFYSVLVGSYCIARFFRYREPSMLTIVSIITVGLLFFGQRSSIVGLVSLGVIVHFIELRERLKPIWLGFTIFAALAASVLLDALRKSEFSPLRISRDFLVGIFFGNSFSDTRDFALVLSFWDRKLFLGKTYLAGFIAFIPRFVSAYRDKWSFGVVTATIAGYSPTEHAGLRVGLFGEAFFNFGFIGVVLLGFFLGATIRLVDLRIKESLHQLPASGMRVYSFFVIGLLTTFAINSSTASTAYTNLVILAVSWIALRVGQLLELPL